ncbi:assimilatory sulfite reductase (NADPH) flavoprotein subunit [Paenibacillus hunanensis]|uniref:assimilatory sulfite reductase (NADPH) flavoprotein subunit n=1 Tax=Paenibacillus hunanensis TaxID=539262 RepID=UPI0020275CD7|nr:assimilatory sulfite reductase (NADPH) flavoprotein subunit [Paenibacillus hunanensis]MCL9659710.1 assimilatory sulfite reductase (NADPH) flavoprotein subunit [Paenibacillus hunanensis]
MEFQATNSPFTGEQAELLNRLLPGLTETQRIWLSGYLTASLHTGAIAAAPTVASSAAVAEPVAPVADVPKDVTVLFGSQTGNAQGLAKKLAQQLTAQGFDVTLSSMGDYKTNNLKKVHNLFVLASTQGEGDPPDNAIPFYEFLHSKRAPQLAETKFAVLGLGDTSYEFFCQTGKDFDKRLEELGAERIVPRADCDVDFEEQAGEWIGQVLSALGEASAAASVAASPTATASVNEEASPYSRTNPFPAEVLENLNLNGRGSDQETRHVELSLEGSGLSYEPGDSLGVYPQNHPQLVEDILQATGWNGDETITLNKNGDTASVRDALLHHYEITVLTKPLLEKVAGLADHEQLDALLEEGRAQDLRAYLQGRDLLDLIQDYGLGSIPADELLSLLRKIPARLYSISSSFKASPDEVHLTVRKVAYEQHGRQRYGVCSVHLAERLEAGDTLPVYIQHNDNFKLPQDASTPIIMIGPGTGVAPFRSFIAEREETGAEGKSWLFFGDRRFATDFLYQTEWQRWLKDGVLTRMDVAFSRDSDKKVYVQHRMLERSRELYEWIQEGAVLYVCGDEKHMANDVHLTLEQILIQEGKLSQEAAAEYLSTMLQQKRYQRDVY